jgi:hypothetical protein
MKQSKPKVAKPAKKEFAFTNSQKETFKLFPLNPLEEQVIQQQVESEWLEAGRELPTKPYYEATTAAGEVQRIELDSREDADTPELIAMWDAYEKTETAFQADFTERFMASCYLCIDAEPNDYPRWKMRMKALKITIPEDEGERLLLFGRTWVIRSTDDITELIFSVTSTVTNVSEEARAAAQDMFRRQMEKAAEGLKPSA